MADQKISQLSDGGASQAADEYVVARSGANYRIDGASVAAAATSVGTLTSLTVSGTTTLASSSGNVGIGVSPSVPLHVKGASNEIMRLQSSDATTGSLFYSFYDSADTRKAYVGYANTGNDLFFIMNEENAGLALGTNGATAATLDASGNLGLGVTPQTGWSANRTTLQIHGTVQPNILFTGSPTNGGAIWTNAYYDGTNNKYIANGAASIFSTSGGAFQWNIAASGTAGNNITFTQAMTLDASGRLQLNTTTAYTRVTIKGSAGIGNGYGILGATANTGCYFGAISATADDDFEIWNERTGYLRFGTANVERARFTSTGAVIVNTTTTGGKLYVYNPATNFETNTIKAHDANASTTSDGILAVVADRNTTNNTFYALGYYNAGAAAFKFRVADSGDVTNTNNSYGAISDEKVKQDIVDAASQWDDIKGLRVRKFRYKNAPDAPLQIGLVAQEAELVSPGLVDEAPDYEEVEITDEDGNVTTERQATGTVTKSVKYSVLYMKSIKALQEAMARIEALEVEVAALKANA